MVCHSLLQWTTFCQTSPPWPSHLGWPHMAWLSFTELDRLWSMWSDWLVFCDYGFSGSALWCPLATLTILLGFLLPWTWGISSWLSSKVQPLLLTLDEVYLLMAAPPDLESGVALLGPSASKQSCSTLCDPMDYKVHGILQARILKWVAFPFSRGSFQPWGRT